MDDAAWYESMSVAMKRREKCLNALARWEEDLAAAEAEIQALRASNISTQASGASATAASPFAVLQEQAVDPSI